MRSSSGSNPAERQDASDSPEGAFSTEYLWVFLLPDDLVLGRAVEVEVNRVGGLLAGTEGGDLILPHLAQEQVNAIRYGPPEVALEAGEVRIWATRPHFRL